jgi:hypothetical protein
MYDAKNIGMCHIHLSKFIECRAPRMNLEANYRLCDDNVSSSTTLMWVVDCEVQEAGFIWYLYFLINFGVNKNFSEK